MDIAGDNMKRSSTTYQFTTDKKKILNPTLLILITVTNIWIPTINLLVSRMNADAYSEKLGSASTNITEEIRATLSRSTTPCSEYMTDSSVYSSSEEDEPVSIASVLSTFMTPEALDRLRGHSPSTIQLKWDKTNSVWTLQSNLPCVNQDALLQQSGILEVHGHSALQGPGVQNVEQVSKGAASDPLEAPVFAESPRQQPTMASATASETGSTTVGSNQPEIPAFRSASDNIQKTYAEYPKEGITVQATWNSQASFGAPGPGDGGAAHDNEGTDTGTLRQNRRTRRSQVPYQYQSNNWPNPPIPISGGDSKRKLFDGGAMEVNAKQPFGVQRGQVPGLHRSPQGL